MEIQADKEGINGIVTLMQKVLSRKELTVDELGMAANLITSIKPLSNEKGKGE